jgi:DNA polymerase IV (DinB-like DNA polymerase)
MAYRRRIILHIDMDSFFAAVEVREHPDLTGKPVIVGADPQGGRGRGVVSTCSYEARNYGVHSGMPISRAFALCPEGVYLPVNYPLYSRVSGNIMHIVRKYGDRFEQVSIDEAYLDISSVHTYAAARDLAGAIKHEIREAEHLTCSIGIGPNKLVAKIASDFQKPDGLTVVEPPDIEPFLFPLPVGKIPGIGRKTGAELKRMGIATIGDLAQTDIQVLQSRFGKWGLIMSRCARGVDASEVKTTRVRKSISKERTFSEDTNDWRLLGNMMDELVEQVHESLIQKGFLFRTITIKVRYSGFITHTKAKTLEHFTRDKEVLRRNAREMLDPFLNQRTVRLIGVRVSNFETISTGQRTITDYGS